MIDRLSAAFRFATGLQSFLSRTLSAEECRQIVEAGLRQRETSFLHLVESAVFGNPNSPYLPLFQRAGVSMPDVTLWLNESGVEGALGKLFDAGIWLSLDEFKGRAPLKRSGLERPIHARDFDNPLLTRHFSLRTGGSRGPGTLLTIDLDYIRHEAADDRQFLESFNLLDRPLAIWRPIPPGTAGLKGILRRAKLGLRVDRWFTQAKPSTAPGDLAYLAITYLSTISGRLWGRGSPFPEYVPLTDARRVAEWLASMTAAGTPALLDTIASSGVRVARAALDMGLDIRGTLFRLGGEPLTPSKVRLVEQTGSRAVCHYAMSEIGRLGLACGAPSELDDVHILTDKVALIQRERATGGIRLPAFFLSSLHPGSPKIAINVESGDYGVVTERDCACPLSQLGLRQHVHHIRSYEKLTTEGMHFMGPDLLHLLEEALPARFGGGPTDYQLVEEEEQGTTRISLVVSPRVGPIDESLVVADVLETLGGATAGTRMMATTWRQGDTLRIVRREPFATSASKIQALHIPPRGETG
ncbi:MAG: hypothetical protein WD906_08190 [Anaerolineales bacterium]